VLREPDDVRRLLLEAALDDRADGSGWMEIQVDPSGYAARFGGLTAFTELVLDAAREAAARAGIGIGVVIAANRTRHPLDARTLARLASQYAWRGVVGFGLSNDERRGRTEDFAAAFAIARRAGLASTPHGGELRGAPSVAAVGGAGVAACLAALRADRVGHGVRCVEDPAVLEAVRRAGVTLEICPTSNVSLGVYASFEEVPVLELLDAGVPISLGADDPLLFGSRLAGQYAVVRAAHGLGDESLAELARMSVRGSCAPQSVRAGLLSGIDDWLASPPQA
jgi:adenosine deaminase